MQGNKWVFRFTRAFHPGKHVTIGFYLCMRAVGATGVVMRDERLPN